MSRGRKSPEGMRFCRRCEQSKPYETGFYKGRRICKSCMVTDQRTAREMDVYGWRRDLLENWPVVRA